MDIKIIKTEIDAIFDLLKSNGIEEAPGVLYVAQRTCSLSTFLVIN